VIDSKPCLQCDQDLPISDFGICRARKDGRNAYCKACVRQRVSAGRSRVREMKTKKVIETTTKRVQRAIRAGFHTREAIQEATSLPMDDVCDALAVLNCERGVVRFRRVEGEACFYPARAA
jgi:hypothetical protein